jgi:hypothetical protein
MSEGFHASELNEDDGGTSGPKVVGERREIVVARLGEDGVAFPTEISATEFWLCADKNGFEVAGMLRRGDVSAAYKSNDVVSGELNFSRRGAWPPYQDYGKRARTR